MSDTIVQKEIADYITDISKRVDKLETGGKPITGHSNLAGVSFTLLAGGYATILADLNWNQPGVTQDPHGRLYFTVFVDNNLFYDYIWPYGGLLNAKDHLVIANYDWLSFDAEDFSETTVSIYIENRSAISHTYYFYDLFSYLGGQSGSGGS